VAGGKGAWPSPTVMIAAMGVLLGFLLVLRQMLVIFSHRVVIVTGRI
jgi:hypothetical protein